MEMTKDIKRRGSVATPSTWKGQCCIMWLVTFPDFTRFPIKISPEVVIKNLMILLLCNVNMNFRLRSIRIKLVRSIPRFEFEYMKKWFFHDSSIFQSHIRSKRVCPRRILMITLIFIQNKFHRIHSKQVLQQVSSRNTG